MTCPILFPSSPYYGLLLRRVPVPSPSQEATARGLELIGSAQEFYIYFSYYWEGGEKNKTRENIGVEDTSAVAGTVCGSFGKHIWLEFALELTLH